MKNVTTTLLMFSVIVCVAGCASYTGIKYRLNTKAVAIQKTGYEIDSMALFPERNSVRRHASLYRMGKMLSGDSMGYVGHIINRYEADPVCWAIYDQDGVEMGSGCLESVWQSKENSGDYGRSFVVDSLRIPFGTYRIDAKCRGRVNSGYVHVPSPSNNVFGMKDSWSVVFGL